MSRGVMKDRVVCVVVEGHHSTIIHHRLLLVLRILRDPQVHSPVGTRNLQGGQQSMPITPIPQPYGNLLQSRPSFHNVNYWLQGGVPVNSNNEMLDGLGNRLVRQRVELRSIHLQNFQIVTARLDGAGRVAGEVGSGEGLEGRAKRVEEMIHQIRAWIAVKSQRLQRTRLLRLMQKPCHELEGRGRLEVDSQRLQRSREGC